MTIIDLSHTMTSGMAQYPGDGPPPRLVRRATHRDQGHLSSALDFGCHVGTHLDTPFHFLDGKPDLAEMPLAAFGGLAQVISTGAATEPGPLPAAVVQDINLVTVDFLIFQTGWERHWGTAQYYAAWPYLAPALAEVLAQAGLKGVGLDTPSVDPLAGQTSHEILAAADMVNVENMANLSALPARPFKFLALPLKLAGTEASPVRAVALI